MKKFIKKTFVIGILVIVFANFMKLLFPPDYHWGNEYFNNKIEYLATDKNYTKFETYFLGSSRIYRHIDPSIYDSLVNTKTGKESSSYNLGSPGTFAPQSYYLYRNFLDSDLSNNAKTVFIELSDIHPVGIKNLSADRNIYWINFKDLNFIVNSVWSNENYGKLKKAQIATTYSLTLLQKLFQFKQYRPYFFDEIETKEKPQYIKNGFYSLDDELSNTLDSTQHKELIKRKEAPISKPLNTSRETALKAFTATSAKIDQVQFSMLQEMITISEKKNIQLYFVFAPRKVSENLVSLYAQLPENNKVEVADPLKYPEMYHPEYTFDIGHLNDKGVFFFTSELVNDQMNSIGIKN